MIIDCYLARIIGTLLDCLHHEGKTKPDRQTHEKGNIKIKGKQRERQERDREERQGEQRDSRDAKTGRIWKKGKVEGC